MTCCTASWPASEPRRRIHRERDILARPLRMASVTTLLVALAAFAWRANATAPSGVAEARSTATAHSVNAGRQVEP